MCGSSKMMDVCGDAENRLATELAHHEVQIEHDILEPLNQLAEVKKDAAAGVTRRRRHANPRLICARIADLHFCFLERSLVTK